MTKLNKEEEIRKEFRDRICIPDGEVGLTRIQLAKVIEKAQGKSKEDFISDICIWLTAREKTFADFFLNKMQEERKDFINQLESNPNEDGSTSPNIQHWIEHKQMQLRKLYQL